MEKRSERGGKKLWRLVYPTLTYYGITMLVSVVASIIISSHVLKDYMENIETANLEAIIYEAMELVYAYTLELQAAAVILTLPVLIYYYQRDRKRRLGEGYVELLANRSPLWMLLIVVFGAITAYAGNGMISLSGLYQVSDGYDEVAQIFYQGKLGLELLCLGVLTPIVEELIFRGLMYRQLTEMMSKKGAILLSALLFGGFHGNLLQMIDGTALALLMIYVYERFNTILAPILFHIGANVLGVLLTETTALSFLYNTAGAMYVSVIIASLLIIGVVWLIEKQAFVCEMHDESPDNL